MIKSLMLRFLYLGVTAFGGPSAHIALFEREFVRRKKELTQEDFTSLLALTNLIPGPNSTEMTQLLGYKKRGILGLWVAGISFILPAFVMVLLFAIAYQKFGSIPQIQWALKGLSPVVLALLISTLWNLRQIISQDFFRFTVFIFSVVLYFYKVPEILILLLASIIFFLGYQYKSLKKYEAVTLFFAFFKIGSLLYGSGYVLYAYLENTFVKNSGFLTHAQLLDAIAIGQLTPGPLFTSASFIGFLDSGILGASLATLGIFLPSFFITSLLAPLWSRHAINASSLKIKTLIDGLNIASLALLAGATYWTAQGVFLSTKSAQFADLDIILWIGFLGSLGLFMFSKVPTWIVLLGGLTIGWLLHFVA